jgi:hypothetical protein
MLEWVLGEKYCLGAEGIVIAAGGGTDYSSNV